MANASILQASKSDLIDVIISLGEKSSEEELMRLNRWPLIQIFVALEDSGYCGHSPKTIDRTKAASLKQFFRRQQNGAETSSEYLCNVKKLAVEAGLNVCGQLYDRLVVGQVLKGMFDSSSREKILSKTKNPRVEDLDASFNLCGFDLHIGYCGHSPKTKDMTKAASLKQFFCRQQNGTETSSDYLGNVKKLAVEAGLNVCGQLYDRLIVGQVLKGMSDSSSREKILSKTKNPRVEDLDASFNFCGFDLLLRMNVQHIWEKIFLSLNYESFKNCFKVSQAWNRVINVESFQVKAKLTFLHNMWLDISDMKWDTRESSKNIINWTAGNEELAFVERIRSSNEVHFINRNGELKSAKLRFSFERVEDMWMLRHVILVKAEHAGQFEVYSIDKERLKETRLFSWGFNPGPNGWTCHTTHFNPGVGVRFLLCKRSGDAAKCLLREVSLDHCSEDEWRPSEPLLRGCCDPAVEKDILGVEAIKSRSCNEMDLTFSDDGSHFSLNNVHVFSIDKGQAGLSINQTAEHSRRVFSKRVVCVKDVEHGTELTVFRRQTIGEGRVGVYTTKDDSKFCFLDLTASNTEEEVVTRSARLFHSPCGGELGKLIELKQDVCLFEDKPSFGTRSQGGAKFIIASASVACENENLPRSLLTLSEWLKNKFYSSPELFPLDLETGITI